MVEATYSHKHSQGVISKVIIDNDVVPNKPLKHFQSTNAPAYFAPESERLKKISC
jgi:hypothetical protein